jgi:5-methylcytosine-specific restriction protein A
VRRKRPCLTCRRLTRNASRCDSCQSAWQKRRDQIRGTAHQRGYDAQWRTTAARAVASHRALFGDWCPGWQVPAHQCTDLTGDHIVPKDRGGSDDPDNIQILCRGCNTRKHNH